MQITLYAPPLLNRTPFSCIALVDATQAYPFNTTPMGDPMQIALHAPPLPNETPLLMHHSLVRWPFQ